MHEEVEPAELALDLREHVRDLRIVGDVARQNQRIGEACGELAHVLLEPFALVGDREPRAGRGRRLRDRPRDRSLVRDADDEARSCPARSVMACGCGHDVRAPVRATMGRSGQAGL